ncbi:MAG: helix-turn-helix domain-containing protein [bacterium]|nr:helix-turn-helix domain-containing protein [bacterium]
MAIESKFYTIKEVAQLLHVSEMWVRRRMNTGEIPSFKLGRRRFFEKKQIDQWIKSQKNEPKTATR